MAEIQIYYITHDKPDHVYGSDSFNNRWILPVHRTLCYDGGGPLNSTLSAVLYIYKEGFFYYHMGYASTLGFFFAGVIL